MTMIPNEVMFGTLYESWLIDDKNCTTAEACVFGTRRAGGEMQAERDKGRRAVKRGDRDTGPGDVETLDERFGMRRV